MDQDVTEAARALSDVLMRENTALAAMDLPHAARLLGEKTRAAEALEAARLIASRTGRLPGDAERDAAREIVARLRALAEDNRTLLERAMRVQARVIAIVAGAIPRPRTAYAAPGRSHRTAATPVALSSRA